MQTTEQPKDYIIGWVSLTIGQYTYYMQLDPKGKTNFINTLEWEHEANAPLPTYLAEEITREQAQLIIEGGENGFKGSF